MRVQLDDVAAVEAALDAQGEQGQSTFFLTLDEANIQTQFDAINFLFSEQEGTGGAFVEIIVTEASGVNVLITRPVVITPDCSVPQPEPTLRPEQPWGCSVNAALGMMVADPLDLVEGRELGPADAAQASGAMRRYREDKVKEITKEETTN